MYYKYKPICPMCKSKNYHEESYTEDCWGAMLLVEEHSYCPDCGYRCEMAYSNALTWYEDTLKGWRDKGGNYHSKNIRKHRRIRRRNKAPKLPVNPEWSKMI